MIVEPTGTNQARDRRHPAGRADDRRRLQVSAGHRPGRIQSQSQRPGRRPRRREGLFQFIEQTWLATLKEQGAGARLRSLCQCHLAAAVGRLRRRRSADDRRDHEPALRSDRQCADGGRLHQGQRRQARRPARPRSDRGRTLHRAFPRRDRREPADRACRHQPADAGRRGVSRARRAPIRRSSTTGAATRAAPARSIACWSAATMWRAADRRMATAVAANASDERRCRASAFAPDTAGLTETYAAAARMSPAAQARRHRRRCSTACSAAAAAGAGGAAGEFALDVAAARRTARPRPRRLRAAAAAARAGGSRRRTRPVPGPGARRPRAVSRPGLSAFRIW